MKDPVKKACRSQRKLLFIMGCFYDHVYVQIWDLPRHECIHLTDIGMKRPSGVGKDQIPRASAFTPGIREGSTLYNKMSY